MENIRSERTKKDKRKTSNEKDQDSFDSREESPEKETKKKYGFFERFNNAIHKVERGVGNVFEKIKEKKFVKRLSLKTENIIQDENSETQKY